LALVGATVGFVAVVAANLQPAAPETRLPGAYRLAALIERQQEENEKVRADVESVQTDLQRLREQLASGRAGVAGQVQQLGDAGLAAGTVGMRGEGFKVTLSDSTANTTPTGNLNDLVIHSQDVQAVVNAFWRSGAEAISVNGQRLVTTSAVLCVGNTLLINGTVHAPPYEVTGIGADREQFVDDELVQQVRADAQRFSLRFSVGREENVEIPAYSGPTANKYAQPTS
jgi:uncharacterized protein YlxW (UPF0749 family)